MIKKHSRIARFLHWISATMVIGLFFSGWYMVELDYYSTWYQTLPELHILVGVFLLLLWIWVILRLFRTGKKEFPPPHKPLERIAAKVVKHAFYLLVTVMIITGYLITTGQGETFVLFEYIKLPAVSHFSADQIDTMGLIHEYSSYLLMMMVVLHAIGALKHHFIDKDDTLKRMI